MAAIIVWLGATLAASLHGSRASVRLADAGLALLRLPAHASDPRLAWPDRVRAGLPGPVLYWVSQASVVVAVVAITVGARRIWHRLNAPTGPLGARPDAGF